MSRLVVRRPPASKPMRLDVAEPESVSATVTSPVDASDLATSDKVRALSRACVDRPVSWGDQLISRTARR